MEDKGKAIVEAEGEGEANPAEVHVMLTAGTIMGSYAPVFNPSETRYRTHSYCQFQTVGPYPKTLPVGTPISIGSRDFTLGSADVPAADHHILPVTIKADTVVASADKKHPWPATRLIEDIDTKLPNQFNIIIAAGTAIVQSNGSESLHLRTRSDLVANISLAMCLSLNRSTGAPARYADWDTNSPNMICAAVSPDCKFVVTVASKIAKVWDVAERKLLFSVKKKFNYIVCFEISPCSRYACLQSENRVIILDFIKRKVKMYFAYTYPTHHRFTCFSSNGKVATANMDTITIYSLDKSMRYEMDRMSNCTANRPTITSMAFSPDNKTIAYCTGDMTIKLWHYTESKDSVELLLRYNSIFGPIVRSYEGHAEFKSINCVCFDSTNEFIIAGCNDYVKIFDRTTGALYQILKPKYERGAVQAVSSCGNKIAIAYSRGHVEIWQHGKSISEPYQNCLYSDQVDRDLVSISMKIHSWNQTVCVVATRKGHIYLLTC